ncbi:MAG: four helix bundle protein [Bacillota bacterium]|nr:four helix bundle protein [Bacillota bacterium]
MARKKSTLAVMTKARELAQYVFDACEKSPRKYRFSLCTKLQNYALNVIEEIYLANSSKDLGIRISHQERARVNLAMTDYFANLANELNCLSIHQYEVISLRDAEAMKLLVAWMNSSKKQLEEVSSPEKASI